MEQVYFKSDYLTIYHNPEKQRAKAVWKGFLTSEQFREGTLRCADFTEQAGIRHWIGDNRRMQAIRIEDQAWFVETLGPRQLRSPLRKMAVVVSYDIYNQMAVDSLIIRASEMIPYEVRHFMDVETAEEWMDEAETPVSVTNGLHGKAES